MDRTGGGIMDGESAIGALTRELHEELGLILPRGVKFATAWVQHLPLDELRIQGFSGVINEVFLVRVPHFDPTPGVIATAEGYPTREGIIDTRWWSTPEMYQAASEGTKFGPRDLPTRLSALLISVANETCSSEVIFGP